MDDQILQNIITDFSNLHLRQKSRKQTTSSKALGASLCDNSIITWEYLNSCAKSYYTRLSNKDGVFVSFL